MESNDNTKRIKSGIFEFTMADKATNARAKITVECSESFGDRFYALLKSYDETTDFIHRKVKPTQIQKTL